MTDKIVDHRFAPAHTDIHSTLMYSLLLKYRFTATTDCNCLGRNNFYVWYKIDEDGSSAYFLILNAPRFTPKGHIKIKNENHLKELYALLTGKEL